MNELLFYLANKVKGDSFLIFKEIAKSTEISRKELMELHNKYMQAGVKYFTLFSNCYPDVLNLLKYPPYVIFYKGNVNLLNSKKIYYLINEQNNPQANSWFKSNIDTLVNNSVLFTNDYDSEADIVSYFRSHNGKIIHIAKSGLNTLDYSDINFENELFISQYPLDAHPKRFYFKEANLIAACISNSLISFSCNENSKVFNLINYFVDLGKDINCFPGSLPNDGNNSLIKSGANLITMISEVLNV
ncbi:DNA processing protein [Mycoplasma seminis]|uniref:DNA processing protein n=1 Tax=Mycoplasma seminis TaxID=512749 RepID=A0ABY9HAI8_9MOLU|nr:DNA processing protein [Mycoplasma seminis]WLP85600.1 DNA processing protein [Mycoplasma seminis]